MRSFIRGGALITSVLLASTVAPVSASDLSSATGVPRGDIAFVRGESFTSVIHTVEADGTSDAPVDPANQGGDFQHAPDWSPDGSKIAFGTAYNNDIFIIDMSGSEPVALDDLDVSGDNPKWSPDGERFAYEAAGPDTDGSGSRTQIFVVDVDGTGSTQITFGQDPGDVGTTGNHSASSPTWSPDGRIAFVRSFDTVFCCSPTGMNLSFRTFELLVMNPDGSGIEVLESDSQGTNEQPANAYSNPDFSPDGKTLAYDHDEGDDGTRDIVLRDMVDGSKSSLTAGSDPSFSPTGRDIAYTAGLDVWRISVEGTDQFNVTAPTGQCSGTFFCGSPAWQPLDVEHERRITTSISGGKASGSVKVPDGFGACRNGVPVKVQRKKGGVWRSVASTRTGSDGRYKVAIASRPGRYRAIAPRTTKAGETCLTARSGVVTP